MNGEKVKEALRNYMLYIAVFVVSAVYIASAFILIQETGKTVLQIIAEGAVIFFIGILINVLMGLQGMMNGEREDCVKETNSRHEDVVRSIIPIIDGLKDFCDSKNKEAIFAERKKRLSDKGIRYDSIFDENGELKPFSPQPGMSKEDVKTIRKMRKKMTRLKLTELTPDALIGNGGRYHDPYYFKTKTEYERMSVRKDIIAKILLSVLFGYFGVTFATFNWANVIWTVLKTAMLVGFGVLKCQQSAQFVKGEYLDGINKKINTLLEFKQCSERSKEEK